MAVHRVVQIVARGARSDRIIPNTNRAESDVTSPAALLDVVVFRRVRRLFIEMPAGAVGLATRAVAVGLAVLNLVMAGIGRPFQLPYVVHRVALNVRMSWLHKIFGLRSGHGPSAVISSKFVPRKGTRLKSGRLQQFATPTIIKKPGNH